MTMNSTLSKIIIFATGAAIGSVVTWKLVRDKYEQITREEIKSIRELYAGSKDAEKKEGSEQAEYEEIIKNSNYVSYTKNKLKPEEKEEEGKDMNEPYVITPEEFSESDYETVTLYCFEDGVITDEMEDVLENADELIVENVMDHFGEYEEDSVYVRNDNIKTDFEILKDCRRYSEVR